MPGDWVIRAVVDCSGVLTDADVRGAMYVTTTYSLPAGGSVTYTASDSDTSNNTASVETNPAAPDHTIFANGFDPPA